MRLSMVSVFSGSAKVRALDKVFRSLLVCWLDLVAFTKTARRTSLSIAIGYIWIESWAIVCVLLCLCPKVSIVSVFVSVPVYLRLHSNRTR